MVASGWLFQDTRGDGSCESFKTNVPFFFLCPSRGYRLGLDSGAREPSRTKSAGPKDGRRLDWRAAGRGAAKIGYCAAGSPAESLLSLQTC